MSQDKGLRKARARTRRSLAATKFDELRELHEPIPEKAKTMQQTEILDLTLEDIASHLAAEAGTREAEIGPVGTLEALLNCMGDMVVVLDSTGTILLPMPCTCLLLGVPSTFLVGRNFTDLAMWYDKGTVARTLSTSGEPIVLECGLRVMVATNHLFVLVCGCVVVQTDSRAGVYGYPLAYVNGRNPYHIAHPDDLPLGLMAHQAVAHNQQAVWLPSRNRGAHQGWFIGYTLLVPCIQRSTGKLRRILSHTYIVHEAGFGDYMPQRNEPLRVVETGALYFEDSQELLDLCVLLKEKTGEEIEEMRRTYDRLEEQLILKEHVDLITSGRSMPPPISSVVPTPPSSSNSCLRSRPDLSSIAGMGPIGFDRDSISVSSGSFDGDRSSQYASVSPGMTQEVCEMLEQLDDLENLQNVLKQEAERQQQQQYLNIMAGNHEFSGSRSSSSPATAKSNSEGFPAAAMQRLSDEGAIGIGIAQSGQSARMNSGSGNNQSNRSGGGSRKSDMDPLVDEFYRVVSLHTKEKLSGAF